MIRDKKEKSDEVDGFAGWAKMAGRKGGQELIR